MIPLIWAIAGVVLVVAEVLSGELVLLMLGVAALGTAAASAAGVPLGPDLAVFAVLSVLFVLVARPAVHRRLRVHDPVNTGTRALLGTHGEVVDAVAAGAGTVLLRGSLWSARSLHDDDLAAGTAVVVVEISGATAVVTPADT
ncbi:NfeD family protein [Actinomycetospora sp.]|uniref:NfeD family protein n=1 Tax=Actinomycetospora sp. TaxID=1872135 RepID=UPI002F40DF1C